MAEAVMIKKTKAPFNWGRFKMKAAPYVFISPFYLSFLVFSSFPILFSIFLAFQKWNGITIMKFNGLKNFMFVLNDFRFWDAMGRTFIAMILTTGPVQVSALFFGFILNSTFIHFKDTFKAVFFLPYITSTVSIGLLFGILYGVNFGLFNFILQTDFVKAFLPIQGPVYWLQGWMTLISWPMLGIWRWVGWVSILYYAGLQAISKSLYEAALVDGASWIQVFFKITLPLLKPIIYFNVTMGMIGGIQSFDEPSILLGRSGSAYGGADYSGVSAAVYMYNTAFSSGFYGRAAAASFVILFFILVLSKINTELFKER